jgi:hypothetical protein
MSKSKSIVIVCLVLLSCTSPDEPSPLPPIKASYEWTIDTVEYAGAGQLLLKDVYGNSNGEVYAVAHCSTGGRGLFWHYTAEGWRDIEVNAKYGGPLPGTVISINKLDGAGNTNIWLAGARIRHTPAPTVWYGFLACYDGQTFKEADLYDGVELTALRVISDNNVYCGGIGTDLYHYNGTTVVEHPLPMEQIGKFSPHPIVLVQIWDIQEINGAVFVSVHLDYDAHGYGKVLLKFDGDNNWDIEIYTDDADRFNVGGLGKLWGSPEGTVYSAGGGIFRYDRSSWTRIAEGTWDIIEVFGTNDRNIWGVGLYNTVIRGVDGVYEKFSIPIPNFLNPPSWNNGWTNESEVFILGSPYDTFRFGMIAHGK